MKPKSAGLLQIIEFNLHEYGFETIPQARAMAFAITAQVKRALGHGENPRKDEYVCAGAKKEIVSGD